MNSNDTRQSWSTRLLIALTLIIVGAATAIGAYRGMSKRRNFWASQQ